MKHAQTAVVAFVAALAGAGVVAMMGQTGAQSAAQRNYPAAIQAVMENPEHWSNTMDFIKSAYAAASAVDPSMDDSVRLAPVPIAERGFALVACANHMLYVVGPDGIAKPVIVVDDLSLETGYLDWKSGFSRLRPQPTKQH